MKRFEYIFFIILLLAGATLTWLRNTTWIEESWDTIAIAIALPLCFYMGMPWRTVGKKDIPLPLSFTVLGVFLYLFGLVGNLTIAMALGWTLCLASLLSRIALSTRYALSQLMILPLMAFPWVIQDTNVIGWYFRLSGAYISALIFGMAGLPVEQMGNYVVIDKTLVHVAEACSGLNLLQSLLIAGSALALIFLGNTRRFWAATLLLFPIAWLANTCRVLAITLAGLVYGVDFAMGIFHTWGGLMVLVIMFLLSSVIFKAMAPKPETTKRCD